MSLPHALLTALLEEASSGLDLARRFDHSIGNFWHATHQQIYRELGRLEQQGWVESLPPETGRGRKRVYRVLPSGRAELARWTAESQDPKPMRDELMLRIRAEAAIGPAGVSDDVRRRLDMHRSKLAIYRQVEARDFPVPPTTRDKQLQHLILRAGIMHEQFWVEWSEEALRVMAKPA